MNATTPTAPAFLARRLALFAAVIFTLSGAAFAILEIVALAVPDLRALRPPSATVIHGVALVALACGWAAARFVRFGATGLAVLDALLVSVLGIAHAAIGICLDGPLARTLGPPAIPMVMGVTIMIVTRAIVVPSTARKTFVIGAFGTVAILAACTFALERAPLPIAKPAILVAVGLWSAIGVAVSTLASHVIYGLRAEAHAARKLGQYTLEEKIGEGGMGVVYRARHAMLRRPTAVKLLAPGREGEVDAARFEREVQATSALTHPNTIAIYDYGRTPEGTLYYAMEYLDGIDLERLVRIDGPQPPGRVIKILTQVCGALAEAHDAGIVHRDVKPANIVLGQRGGLPDVAKVLDFGLARCVGGSGTAADGAILASGAFGAAITGTPLYLAPEAIVDPAKADARSDLYALGCVAYWLLTGRTPFDGENPTAVFARHLSERPPRPSEIVRTLPADLEAVVLACLEKSPSARPSDARTLSRALGSCASAHEWTEDDGRAWWRTRGEVLANHPRRRSGETSGSATIAAIPPPATMPVDLRARVAF